MMRFDADLYRIAAGFESTEQTRYYLNGVFIEPCLVGGVTMTATDGHRLICIRDESGQADQAGIVQLSPEAMKLCKSKPRELRRVTIDGLNATVECERRGSVDPDAQEWEGIGMSQKVFVDGTFPDYRRVVPHKITIDATKGHSWFAGRQVASFSAAAVELEKQANTREKGSICYCAGDCDSPSLVLFAVSHAFGVIMPIRGTSATTPPDWFFSKAKEQAA